LITGGGSGIGLGLAEKFISMGHTVIATGRRQSQLDKAQVTNPKLKTIQGDVSTDSGRIAIYQKVIKEFPEVNVLINNAGIISAELSSLKETTASDWEGHKQIFDTNLIGTVHLSILFTPHFITKPDALIINVTSVMAYFPVAMVPTYCASKGLLKFI
jgi:uncharacterized oxidoreductase